MNDGELFMKVQHVVFVVTALLLLSASLWAVQDTPKLVRVEPGSYWRGSNEKNYPEENPRHQVTISYPFWIGRCEVTQREYETVMGANPSRYKSDQRPVETVS